MSSAASSGTVLSLRRYPVKSMQGEEVEAAPVTAHGLLGDRAYAVVDRETGYIASAKHPRKWRSLLACRAAYTEPPQPDAPLPPVLITLPNGDSIRSDEPDVDMILSWVLGRAVSLITEAPATPLREADRTPIEGSTTGLVINRETMALAAPAGTFFDYAPLHLLTTSTLERLVREYSRGRFDPRRFRPNILISLTSGEIDFVENAWIGHAVRIGEETHLHVLDPCPRCIVTTLAQADLPHDPTILRTIAQHNAADSATLSPGTLFPAVVGVYANTLGSGIIRRGDFVQPVLTEPASTYIERSDYC